MASQELARRKKIVETFGVKRHRLESLKRQPAHPTTWIDLAAQQPNYTINFTDIQLIVQGFLGLDYLYGDPANCP